MELVKKQIVKQWSGKPVTDQFLIDEDYNVPDNKKDIKKVMISEGELRIEGIRKVDNYVKVHGKLLFHILYVTDEAEEKMAELSGQFPFEEMVYTEEERGDWLIRSTRTDVTAVMIHSRKLNIRTMAEMVLVPETGEEGEVTVDVEGVDRCCKKKADRRVLKMQNTLRDTYRIKEEIRLPKGRENIAALLWTDMKPQRLDTKLVADSLIVEGELLVFCFYETPDETLNWIEEPVRFEGRIPCPGADETMYHQIDTAFTDENAEARLDEDGEMRIIGIEASLEVKASVFEEEEVELLEDLYSLSCNLTVQKEMQECEQLVMQNHLKCSVSETLSLPELKDNIFQICHTSGSLEIVRTEAKEEGIQVEGILHIGFLYVKPDDDIPFDTWQGMVPFTCVLECNEMYPDVRSSLNGYIEQLSVNLLGQGKAEVKATVSFRALVRRPVSIENIAGLTVEERSMEELAKRPGIVGYAVKDGDDLFGLAKRFGTTEESICEVNGIEKEKGLQPGERILIFKENLSIL